MNVVMGHAELLAEHEDGDVRNSAEVIESTATDLLDLSEKARTAEESIVGDVDTESFDVIALVRDRVATLGQEYSAIEFELDLPAEAWIDVNPLFPSVVDNLLENAIEHCTNETSRIRVSVMPTTVHDVDHYTIAISDNGPGIPSRELDILQPGEKAPTEHTSGMELWLVSWIVSQSDGGSRSTSARTDHGSR